jgi:hypothetical protein
MVTLKSLVELWGVATLKQVDIESRLFFIPPTPIPMAIRMFKTKDTPLAGCTHTCITAMVQNIVRMLVVSYDADIANLECSAIFLDSVLSSHPSFLPRRPAGRKWL